MPPISPEPIKTVHDQAKLRPYSFTAKKRVMTMTIVGILVIAFVAFVALALLSTNSTPDQKLYGFKTGVLEPVVKATKLSDASKLRYTSELLDKRVAELLTLYSDNSTSTEETSGKLAELTKEHTSDSVWIIQQSSSLSAQEKIQALAEITNSTRAFETLADNTEEFSSIKDSSEEIQNISQDGLGQEVANFASTSDATTLATFVGEQIAAVGEEIKTVAPSSRAQKLALTRIDDAGEAISDSNFLDAINFLLRARQAIAVDTYLYAAERGEGAAETYDPGEVPEGS